MLDTVGFKISVLILHSFIILLSLFILFAIWPILRCVRIHSESCPSAFYYTCMESLSASCTVSDILRLSIPWVFFCCSYFHAFNPALFDSYSPPFFFLGIGLSRFSITLNSWVVSLNWAVLQCLGLPPEWASLFWWGCCAAYFSE